MKEMNWLILLISALATYRLSLMLSSEEGPLAIFARMRRKVPPKTNPGRGIRCFMCWSVWVAAAVTLYLLWLGTITKEILPLLVQRLQTGVVAIRTLERLDRNFPMLFVPSAFAFESPLVIPGVRTAPSDGP